MERRDKDSYPLSFDLAYSQITTYAPIPYLNFALIILQHIIFLAKFYDLVPTVQTQISPTFFQSFFSSVTPFVILTSLLVIFVILTLISYNLNLLTTLWVYLLLLLETLQMLYIEASLQCFTGSRWCQSDIKL